MRRLGLVSGIVGAVLVVAGTVGVLAANGDLPWQGRAAEIARDGTAVPPTTTAATTPE